MPTIDVEYLELERLLGIDLNWKIEKLDEILAYVKGEVKLFNEQEGIVSIEMKDTNRPDLWSAEGLARGLRCYLGYEKGFRQYSAEKPLVEVNVDPRLHDIRPFIACAVVKNVHLNDPVIRGLMHQQDSLTRLSAGVVRRPQSAFTICT